MRNLTKQHGVHAKEASIADHNSLVENTTCKTLETPLLRVKIFWGIPQDPLEALASGPHNLVQRTFQSHLLIIISVLL